MAYTKQEFKDGQVLKAEHLNKMEDELVSVNEEIDAIVNNFENIEDLIPESVATDEEVAALINEAIGGIENGLY